MNSGPESCTGIGVVAWLFVIWRIRTWLREKPERRWSESPNMAIIQLGKETPKLATTYLGMTVAGATMATVNLAHIVATGEFLASVTVDSPSASDAPTSAEVV